MGRYCLKKKKQAKKSQKKNKKHKFISRDINYSSEPSSSQPGWLYALCLEHWKKKNQKKKKIKNNKKLVNQIHATQTQQQQQQQQACISWLDEIN